MQTKSQQDSYFSSKKKMGLFRNNKELQSGTCNHGKPHTSLIKQRGWGDCPCGPCRKGRPFFFFLGRMKVKWGRKRGWGLSTSPLSGGQKGSFSRRWGGSGPGGDVFPTEHGAAPGDCSPEASHPCLLFTKKHICICQCISFSKPASRCSSWAWGSQQWACA